MDHHDEDWSADHPDAAGSPEDLPESPEHDPGDYDSAGDHSGYGGDAPDYGADDTGGDAPPAPDSDNLDADDLSGDQSSTGGDPADHDATGTPPDDHNDGGTPAQDHDDGGTPPDDHNDGGTPAQDHGTPAQDHGASAQDHDDAGGQPQAPADDAGEHGADHDGAPEHGGPADGHNGDDSSDAAAAPSETFGAGLDSTGDHDGSWHDDEFPEQLDLHAPEPLDGYPWTDPGSLGSVEGIGEHDALDATQPADPQDLFDYDGMDAAPDANPWEQLLGSDDPATSALARWWGPIG